MSGADTRGPARPGAEPANPYGPDQGHGQLPGRLNDSGLSARDRLTYLEVEAATYTAAAHLGVKAATAEKYVAELAAGSPP